MLNYVEPWRPYWMAHGKTEHNFLKGTSQETYLQILVKIGLAVSEELTKMKIPIGSMLN